MKKKGVSVKNNMDNRKNGGQPEKLPALDLDRIISATDEESKLIFNYFADQIDNQIQNNLFFELIARYSDISKQLDDKNKQLKKYTEQLEELVQEKVKEISASQIATIHALVKAAESRDDDTGTHIERTSLFCKIIAEKLHDAGKHPEIIDGAFADTISKASPLHDIGKVGIKDAILLKPGRLTPDEFEIMKTHVNIGYEMLETAQRTYPGNMFLKMGLEIARYHHEKWNGSGYMNGISGEDIPVPARIMALSDVYDALRSRRVYKEPFSHEKTYGIILEGRGSHFDPLIVDIFVETNLLFEKIFDRLAAENK